MPQGIILPTPPATPTPAAVALSLATTALPNATQGSAYSASLAAAGGTAPYTFALASSSALPLGLQLVSAGTVAGIPTVTGLFSFSVIVTDHAGSTANGVVSLAIPTLPAIQNTSLPDGAVEVSYTASLVASGGAAPYGYQVTSGALPLGLTLATNGGITGLPTVSGTSTFTVQVYDSNSPQGTSTETYTILIAAQNAAETEAVRSLDKCVLLGGADGALYAIVPGQKFDESYGGEEIGYLQQWTGVPTSGGKLAEYALGGVTIGAKGSGQVNVFVIDDRGNKYPLTSDKRPYILATDDSGNAVESNRDFMAKGIPKSTRYALSLDNGAVAGAWFEVHVAMLWVRPYWPQRRA